MSQQGKAECDTGDDDPDQTDDQTDPPRSRRRSYSDRCAFGLGFRELQPCIADPLQSRPGIFAKAALDELTNANRSSTGKSLRIRITRQDGREHVGHRLALEEFVSGEHFPQNDPERPDIGAPVDLPAPRLFW